jgi:hypothetical protein
LYFVYEPSQRSVVIGPALINSANTEPGSLGTLERGGSETITFSKWQTKSGKRSVARKKKRINVKARPFMQPAFDTELKGLSRIWDKARR